MQNDAIKAMVPAPRIPIFAKLTVFVVIVVVCSFAVRNADNKSTDVVHRSWCRTMQSMQWCPRPAYLSWWNWPFLLSLLLFVFTLFLMPTTRVQMLSTGVDAGRCNDARIPLLVLLYEVDDSFNCVTQLMLYTGDKLSSTIFCCLYVRHRCHRTKSPLFPIYTGIQALCWPCTT